MIQRWEAPAGPVDWFAYVGDGKGLVFRRRFYRPVNSVGTWAENNRTWRGPWRLMSRTAGLRLVG